MLMIRLQRVGRKNDPSFRMVVVDSHEAAQTGKVIEVVGSYDARQGSPIVKEDRVTYWMSVGAKLSDTAYNLLVRKGIIKGEKKNIASKKLGKKVKAIVATKTAKEEKDKADALKKAEQAQIDADKTQKDAEEIPAPEVSAEKVVVEAVPAEVEAIVENVVPKEASVV
ncbi:MAG: 30S ribosomal protein S16 [Candidatus Vogelbacteria bacterium]|nr:30S ribosomal protein S16 [Candidatus Vogelbacteria bacterium]